MGVAASSFGGRNEGDLPVKFLLRVFALDCAVAARMRASDSARRNALIPLADDLGYADAGFHGGQTDPKVGVSIHKDGKPARGSANSSGALHKAIRRGPAERQIFLPKILAAKVVPSIWRENPWAGRLNARVPGARRKKGKERLCLTIR